MIQIMVSLDGTNSNSFLVPVLRGIFMQLVSVKYLYIKVSVKGTKGKKKTLITARPFL
jgi:hypothetical protein